MSSSTRRLRRGPLVGAMLGCALAMMWGPAGAGLAPTPSLPVEPLPNPLPEETDSDLTQVEGRAGSATGTPLLLAGRVLDAAGREVADARVEIWHADAHGRRADEAADGGFQRYGRTETGGEGRFTFRTVRPGTGKDRAAHINIRISAPGFGSTTTRIFLAEDPSKAEDLFLAGIRDPAIRSRLVVPLVASTGNGASPGAVKADVEIVLSFNRSAPA